MLYRQDATMFIIFSDNMLSCRLEDVQDSLHILDSCLQIVSLSFQKLCHIVQINIEQGLKFASLYYKYFYLQCKPNIQMHILLLSINKVQMPVLSDTISCSTLL